MVPLLHFYKGKLDGLTSLNKLIAKNHNFIGSNKNLQIDNVPFENSTTAGEDLQPELSSTTIVTKHWI